MKELWPHCSTFTFVDTSGAPRQDSRFIANSSSCLSVTSPGHFEAANHRKNELAAMRLFTPSRRHAFAMGDASSLRRTSSNRAMCPAFSASGISTKSAFCR